MTLIAALLIFRSDAHKWYYRKKLLSEDEASQRHAAMQLARMGDTTAIMPLLRIPDPEFELGFRDNFSLNVHHDHYVFDAIALLGRDAVPELLRILESDEGHVRANAGVALARLGDDAHTAIPVLIDRLEHGSHHLSLCIALSGLGAEARSAAPILLERIREDPDTLTMLTLYSVTRGGTETMAMLRELRNHEDPQIRSLVFTLLEKVAKAKGAGSSQ